MADRPPSLRMTTEEALLELRAMRGLKLKQLRDITEKRTWTPAERIIAKTIYEQQESALYIAIQAAMLVGS